MAKCCSTQAGTSVSDCGLLQASFILAGLAMMLNIRLSYSSAPYALIRFRLPENLFSVFVRRMASALELWCLPSMLLGNIMEIGLKAHYQKEGYTEDWTSNNKGNLKTTSGVNDVTTPRKHKNWIIIIPSIISQWLNFLTYVILFFVYLMGGDQGHLTTFYWVIAISGVVFGINMTLIYAVDFNYIPVYLVGENSFPIVTSFMHYLTTLIFGNRRKWDSDFLIVGIDIIVAILISFVAASVWTVAYAHVVDGPGGPGTLQHIFTYKFSASFRSEAISPFLMIVVGMGLVYAIYPGIAPGMIVPFYLIDKIEMVLLIATIFPPVIIALLRRYYPDWSPSTKYVGHDKDGVKSGFGGWTYYISEHKNKQDPGGGQAPDFRCKTGVGGESNPDIHAWIWHLFDILMVIKISLAYIFIYSLHYRDSSISRAIVNQPKMSTFLSIVFYMCHEILLALGFPGIIGNDGGDLILIPQYIGALFMIFLAFYSEGYIIEYKSHDPAHWPTEGMTKWNAFLYWCNRSSKITNHNLTSLFKNYLFRGLLLFILYILIYDT